MDTFEKSINKLPAFYAELESQGLLTVSSIAETVERHECVWERVGVRPSLNGSRLVHLNAEYPANIEHLSWPLPPSTQLRGRTRCVVLVDEPLTKAVWCDLHTWQPDSEAPLGLRELQRSLVTMAHFARVPRDSLIISVGHAVRSFTEFGGS